MSSLKTWNCVQLYCSAITFLILFLHLSVSADTVITSSSTTQAVDSNGKVQRKSILSTRQTNATHTSGVQIISSGNSGLYDSVNENVVQVREKRQASSAAASAAAAAGGGGRGGSSSAAAAAAAASSGGGGRGLGGSSSAAAASAASSSSGGGGNRYGGGPGRYGYGGGPGRYGFGGGPGGYYPGGFNRF